MTKWKLVPVDPTPEMTDAGYFVIATYHTGANAAKKAYSAMLEAAPQPPVPSVPDGWKHDCAGIMQNDVELWLDSCPHCGKPKTDAAPTPAEAPADVARWIDPNDKTQKQYLPHVGERVLFCHDGRTYYGKHTGGSFISFTHPGNTYPTWGCHWMYPPKATDAAMSEKGQS